MLNNRPILIIMCAVLILSLVSTVVFFVARDDTAEPQESVTDTVSDSDTTHTHDHESGFQFEHTTGEAVIEFDEGNEMYFDTSILPYLERMEKGVPVLDENGNYTLDEFGNLCYDPDQEQNIEGVLDNLITLINHFAKEGYSVEASQQIQRFYVMFYDRVADEPYETLVAKLAVCFPAGGADSSTLSDTVAETFGIYSGDDYSLVFFPLAVMPLNIDFANVKPNTVELSAEDEALCIYDECSGNLDEHYERNLEGWLHNIVSMCGASDIPADRIRVAQLLYTHSLTEAEFRADWDEALIRCLAVESWDYDTFKAAVDAEFGVTVDHNVPVQNYFEDYASSEVAA